MNPTLKLVERQIASSALRKRLETADHLPGRYVSPDGVAFGPCLLISRECGSGGSQLAQLTGEQLGWNVFDSKIVDEIAHAANVHQRLVETVDEHIHSLWEQNWREFLLDELPDKKYLRHLRQVVMTLGHHGNVVLVGRGAQYLLPPQCGLRVRVVAPLEMRIQNVAEGEKISREQAKARIKAVDAERNAFVWKVFRKDVSSPLNHDVVINTAKIELEIATQIVLAMLQNKLGFKLDSHPFATTQS
jgi:cytidylate kinase